MDYAQSSRILSAGANAAQPKPETPLDRISYFADRIESSVEQISRFNNRFYSEPNSDKSDTVKPVPSGHLGQIERLGGAIDDLCNTIQRLSDIG